jgi:nucleoside-diphosphate-sugar epimerase
MRVVIIGGAGHVGTYLVPHLVEAGHEGRIGRPRIRKGFLASGCVICGRMRLLI